MPVLEVLVQEVLEKLLPVLVKMQHYQLLVICILQVLEVVLVMVIIFIPKQLCPVMVVTVLLFYVTNINNEG